MTSIKHKYWINALFNQIAKETTDSREQTVLGYKIMNQLVKEAATLEVLATMEKAARVW